MFHTNFYKTTKRCKKRGAMLNSIGHFIQIFSITITEVASKSYHSISEFKYISLSQIRCNSLSWGCPTFSRRSNQRGALFEDHPRYMVYSVLNCKCTIYSYLFMLILRFVSLVSYSEHLFVIYNNKNYGSLPHQ